MEELRVEAVVTYPGHQFVTVAGEVDMATAPDLQHALLSLVEEGVHTITVDLAGVAFMDLTGLAAIERVAELMDVFGRDFELRNPSPPVRYLLDFRAQHGGPPLTVITAD